MNANTANTLQFAIGCAFIAFLVYMCSGCSSHVARAAVPISESHSQITASEYDLVESAFAGGQLAPMPVELADARCQELLEKRDLARAFSHGFGVATGGSGIATLIPKDASEKEKRDWDLVLGISTLALGITSTVLGGLVQSWTSQYELECMTETPAPVEANADTAPNLNSSDVPETEFGNTDGGVE